MSNDTLDTLRGRREPDDDIGDTRHLVSGHGATSIAVAETDAAAGQGEIVELLSRSIAETPYRVDLWLMRFQMYRSLGMKPEFEAALHAAWAHTTVRKQLDWRGVKHLWEELAPGAPLPAGIELVEAPAATAVGAAPAPAEAGGSRAVQRRFSDLALQRAGAPLAELARAYGALRAAPGYFEKLAYGVGAILNRPSSLQIAQSLNKGSAAGARIYLKREDQRRLAPEVENAVAQAYVARALGRRILVGASDVIAHAQALAMVAPRFELSCVLYVRPEDATRQATVLDTLRGRGVQVEIAQGEGARDPRLAALEHWRTQAATTHLALSLGTGPRPYPMIVNDFQSLLGREADSQLRAVAGGNRPRVFIAAPHGEADAIGFVLPFLPTREVEMFFAEARVGGGSGSRRSEWMRPYQGLQREHAWLRASGRIRYVAIGDDQARAAQQQLAQQEGVQASLEDARAVAQALVLARIANKPLDIVALVG